MADILINLHLAFNLILGTSWTIIGLLGLVLEVFESTDDNDVLSSAAKILAFVLLLTGLTMLATVMMR